MFGGPEVSYHQTYSARDWLSILRTPYPTQNLHRKHRTDQLEDRRSIGASSCNSGDGTDQRVQYLIFMMMMMMKLVIVVGISNCVMPGGILFKMLVLGINEMVVL